MRKVKCNNFWEEQHKLLIKGNAEIRFTFFYSRRSYWLLCKTFFCTRDTTYFLGSNFLCFLPDCSTQHKGWLQCLSVSLRVSLGQAIIFSLNRSTMSEICRWSFWNVHCSRQTLIFSLPTIFFHFKHRWFFFHNVPIILNEHALELTFDAAGQWSRHVPFSALPV